MRQLWSICFGALIFALMGLVPLLDQQVWWDLFMGHLTDTYRAIPNANHVLYTHPVDTPSLHQAWFGQWLLYACHKHFGIAGVLVWRNMMAALSAMLVLWYALAKTQVPTAHIMALGTCGFVLSWPAIHAHTMMLVIPVFSLTLCVLHAAQMQHGTKTAVAGSLVLALCSIFWTNTEISFLWPTCCALAIAMHHTTQRKIQKKQILTWYFGAAISLLLCVLCSPHHFAILAHLVTVFSTYPTHPDAIAWSTLFSHSVVSVACLCVALCVLIGCWFKGSRSRNTLIYACLLLGILTLFMHRFAWMFGISWTLAMVDALSTLHTTAHTQKEAAAAQPKESSVSYTKVRMVVVLLVASLSWLMQPLLATHATLALSMSPYALRTTQPHRAVLTSDVPIVHTQILKNMGKPPKTYIAPKWSGFILFHLLKARQLDTIVPWDARVEWTNSKLLDLRNLVEQGKIWRGVFAQFHVTAAMLDKKTQATLIQKLHTHAQWQTAHEDQHMVLLVRVLNAQTTTTAR